MRLVRDCHEEHVAKHQIHLPPGQTQRLSIHFQAKQQGNLRQLVLDNILEHDRNSHIPELLRNPLQVVQVSVSLEV